MINQQQPPSFNDDFEKMLSARLQQAQPYIADDNFTANVMQTLSTRKALSPLQERLIKIVPVFIISLLVLSQFSAVAVFVSAWKLLFTLNPAHLLQVACAMAVAMLLGATAWFAKQAKVI